MKLSRLTKDAAATIGGAVLAGANAAASAYLAGGAPTKEALCASAIIGITAWFWRKGDKSPVVKEKQGDGE